MVAYCWNCCSIIRRVSTMTGLACPQCGGDNKLKRVSRAEAKVMHADFKKQAVITRKVHKRLFLQHGELR